MIFYQNCFNDQGCCIQEQQCCDYSVKPNVIIPGILGYGSFYFTTPVATVTIGNPFSFPSQNVTPFGGISRLGGTSTTTFVLSFTGIYEFSWQMTTQEGDVQIAIRLNNVELASSRIGTGSVGVQQTNNILLPVTAGSNVQLIVAAGSSSPATPVILGGTTSTTGNFVIKRISNNIS